MIPDLIIEEIMLKQAVGTPQMPAAEVITSGKRWHRGIIAPVVVTPIEVVPPARYKRDWKSPVQPRATRRAATTKAKWLEKGRVDPSAEFHGVRHDVACEIDSHKNKRPSSGRTLPPELQARVDFHRSKKRAK